MSNYTKRNIQVWILNLCLSLQGSTEGAIKARLFFIFTNREEAGGLIGQPMLGKGDCSGDTFVCEKLSMK